MRERGGEKCTHQGRLYGMVSIQAVSLQLNPDKSKSGTRLQKKYLIKHKDNYTLTCYFLQLTNSSCLEIYIFEHETLLCAKFEGFDDTESEDS